MQRRQIISSGQAQTEKKKQEINDVKKGGS
jgi:hypothetical protein